MRALVVALLLALAAPAFADGVSEGTQAPDFDAKAKTSSGKKFRLKKLRGNWVVVTIGASWCKPCKKELPAWDKVAGKYKGKVTFIAVNIDNDAKKGAAFVKKLKIRNMQVVYSPEDKTTTADAYIGNDDSAKFPTTFVIDPKGRIVHVHQTYHDGDAKNLSSKLDELIGD
jgi:thiol-disulfide isomerase/thioredoxin